MDTVKVALINDYEVVVHGLEAMLRSYRDRIEVVELDTNHGVATPVDVALYDTFAGLQGDRERVHELSRDPRVDKVVVYSWNVAPRLVSEALTNGAAGYVSKELPAGSLVAAVEAIHHGEEQVFAGEHENARPVGGDWPGREEGLTPREAEILALISQGLTNDQIADRTGLSINSIKSYIRTCYRRIGVTDRANAVLWGVDHGFRSSNSRSRRR